MKGTHPQIDMAALVQASKRVAPYIRRTPALRSDYIDRLAGASLYFKCENFQETGSFKMRGAANAVFSLSEAEAAAGVATHSSGNHAQAVARAAALRGIPAYIVMPENAPLIKQRGVREYEGKIIFCEATLDARERTLHEVIDRTGASFIPPYNDYRTIAGQATCAMELLEEYPDLDYIIAPVGGGGLLSGTALAAFYTSPSCKVTGAEPEAANDAWLSLKAGYLIPVSNPQTIADGLRTSLGNITFEIISQHVHNIETATEATIVKAMRIVWERLKIVVEPSCVLPLAVLLEQQKEEWKGKKIGLILTGGNVDLDKLPWL